MQQSSAAYTGLIVEAPFMIKDEFATTSFHVCALPPGCTYQINIAAHESNLLLSPFLAVDCKRSLCLFVLLGMENKVVCCNSGSSQAKTEQGNLMQGADEDWT
jgi:hypothetical protein